MTECLLTLIATPELEERLADWLLEAGHQGFTTTLCRGHGVEPERLSTAEQVVGRERRVAFWIQTSEVAARAILAGLASEFGSARLHYWMGPILSAGPIVRQAEVREEQTTEATSPGTRGRRKPPA